MLLCKDLGKDLETSKLEIASHKNIQWAYWNYICGVMGNCPIKQELGRMTHAVFFLFLRVFSC